MKSAPAWENKELPGKILEVELLQNSQAAEARIVEGLETLGIEIRGDGDCSMLIGVEGFLLDK